jgi:CMP/dCMP kinase
LKEKIQIAIDGPAGSGKSTVAKAIAQQLGLLYVDTGAMYRVVAYKALNQNIPLGEETAIITLAKTTDIRQDHSEAQRVYCDGVDVTEMIRTPEVSRSVSIVAAYPGVRERLVELQRLEAERGGVVMDGRDIGTYVLPNADLKIFLTASLEERAKRRWLELQQSGKVLDIEEVKMDIKRRDQLDAQREVAPLIPATDAIILDTTDLTVQDIVERILAMTSV